MLATMACLRYISMNFFKVSFKNNKNAKRYSVLFQYTPVSYLNLGEK